MVYKIFSKNGILDLPLLTLGLAWAWPQFEWSQRSKSDVVSFSTCRILTHPLESRWRPKFISSVAVRWPLVDEMRMMDSNKSIPKASSLRWKILRQALIPRSSSRNGIVKLLHSLLNHCLQTITCNSTFRCFDRWSVWNGCEAYFQEDDERLQSDSLVYNGRYWRWRRRRGRFFCITELWSPSRSSRVLHLAYRWSAQNFPQVSSQNHNHCCPFVSFLFNWRTWTVPNTPYITVSGRGMFVQAKNGRRCWPWWLQDL